MNLLPELNSTLSFFLPENRTINNHEQYDTCNEYHKYFGCDLFYGMHGSGFNGSKLIKP